MTLARPTYDGERYVDLVAPVLSVETSEGCLVIRGTDLPVGATVDDAPRVCTVWQMWAPDVWAHVAQVEPPSPRDVGAAERMQQRRHAGPDGNGGYV